MNAPDSPKTQETYVPTSREEITLIDFLIVFAKRKKLILGLPVLFALCAGLASLALPNIYRATTTIVPSQQYQSSAAAVLNQLGGFAGTTPGTRAIRIPNELLIGMLKSRTVANNLIQRFNLQRAYGVDTIGAAWEVLDRNSRIAVGSDGVIVIDVEDKDPKRAVEIANAFVDELLKVTKKMALTEASHRRLFFERRLQTLKDQLAEAEVALKSAQEIRGAIIGDRQALEMAETTARLRAQIADKEIQLGAMEAFVTINNQEYNRGQQEIGAMRADLARLENGSSAPHGRGRKLETPVRPDDVRLLRDVKYYQMLQDLVAKQYEVARIDEARDSATLEVLDKAVEPERNVRPKRSRIVLASALFGLLIAIFWVLFLDVLQLGKNPEEAEKLQKLKRYLGFR